MIPSLSQQLCSGKSVNLLVHRSTTCFPTPVHTTRYDISSSLGPRVTQHRLNADSRIDIQLAADKHEERCADNRDGADAADREAGVHHRVGEAAVLRRVEDIQLDSQRDRSLQRCGEQPGETWLEGLVGRIAGSKQVVFVVGSRQRVHAENSPRTARLADGLCPTAIH